MTKAFLATLLVILVLAVVGVILMVWLLSVYSEEPFDAMEAKRRQQETARILGIPERLKLDLGDGVSMEFVLIPAGEFMMGSPSGEGGRDSDEGPLRRVKLSKGFYMGIYEVTQAQYRAIMGTNPSYFKGDTNPVDRVTWDDATEFCRKVSRNEGKACRLPTEAEWEYACRVGTETRFSFGDNYSSLGDYAWYNGNSSSRTRSVGQKKPNTFGLYDMYGNVWEWCSDWPAGSYANTGSTDPQGSSSGTSRALRGGGWCGSPDVCRSADRNRVKPGVTYDYFGFRVVLEIN